MAAFDDAVVLTVQNDGFTWTVPDGWQQGRGAWGGLVVAACVRAVEELETAERPVRAITVQMSGPVLVGEQHLDVRQVRRGSAMTTWNVDIADASGMTNVHASVITGAPRDVDGAAQARWGRARMGARPEWADVPAVEVGPPTGPAFGPHLDFRPIAGIPGSGGEASTRGWVGFRDGAPWTAARALGIVDAWWPGALVASDRIRPLATVMFAATLLVDPRDLGATALLYYEADLTGTHDGFTSEIRRLWSPEGHLIVENLQSIVVIA